MYKGIDMVCKCVELLQSEYEVDFVWRVFGNVNKHQIKVTTKSSACFQHVEFLGVAGPEEIKSAINESTVFVHPSYIDNSPNSVCEAQILGCSVVAQNVGGLASLVKHECDGILVPANDPYQMASAIMQLYENRELNMKMGANAQSEAIVRHNRACIIKDLKCIYEKYLK